MLHPAGPRAGRGLAGPKDTDGQIQIEDSKWSDGGVVLFLTAQGQRRVGDLSPANVEVRGHTLWNVLCHFKKMQLSAE